MSFENKTQITELKINDKEYSKEELTTYYNEIVDKITERINEIGALNPKIKQIVDHEAKTLDDIPDELIIFCSKNNIPIFYNE